MERQSNLNILTWYAQVKLDGVNYLKFCFHLSRKLQTPYLSFSHKGKKSVQLEPLQCIGSNDHEHS